MQGTRGQSDVWLGYAAMSGHGVTAVRLTPDQRCAEIGPRLPFGDPHMGRPRLCRTASEAYRGGGAEARRSNACALQKRPRSASSLAASVHPDWRGFFNLISESVLCALSFMGAQSDHFARADAAPRPPLLASSSLVLSSPPFSGERGGAKSGVATILRERAQGGRAPLPHSPHPHPPLPLPRGSPG